LFVLETLICPHSHSNVTNSTPVFFAIVSLPINNMVRRRRDMRRLAQRVLLQLTFAKSRSRAPEDKVRRLDRDLSDYPSVRDAPFKHWVGDADNKG
jgi:hypothetical protein